LKKEKINEGDNVMNIEITIYLASNLFCTYILYRFMRLFFDSSDVNIKIELAAFTIYYVISSSVYLLLSTPVFNLLTSIILFFSITYIYEGFLKTRLIATFFTYTTGMLVDSLVCNVIIGVVGANQIGNIIGIPSNLLLFTVVLIFEKVFNKNKEHEINLYQMVAIVFIPAGSISIIVVLFLFGYTEVPTVIVSIVLLTINLIVFYLYDQLLKYYEDKIRNEVLDQQNSAYKNQFEIIKRSQKNTDLLKHDMKNHIIAIGNLVSKDSNEEVIEYLDTISSNIDLRDEYVNSGNKYVDSILNYKIKDAKTDGIDVDVDIQIPEEFNIEPFDISVILGNLLDNAVEAVRNIDDKKIDIDMKMDKSVLFIKTSNHYTGKIKEHNHYIKSTKQATEKHGLGLKSIENSIKKYNGIMDIDYSENMFEVNVMMYN
jgi:hypothetical protein